MTASATETASEAIRTLLARGRYQPGDRLPPERELAEGLTLSRPTVREAIRRLTEAGLLEARRGSGTYVARVDWESVFAVRLRLEPFAAGLAARNRTSAALRRLDDLVEALARQIEHPDEFAATDFEIHQTVAEASGNPILADLLRRLADLTLVSRAMTSPSPETRRAALRHLRALVRAVRAGKPQAAAAAMEADLAAVREAAARTALPDRQIPRARAGASG